MQNRQSGTRDDAPLVSESDLGVLRSYLEHVELDSERLDALGNIWLEASREERPLIASCYPQYFTNPQFVSKLSSKGCARLTQAGTSTGSRSAQQSSGGAGAAATSESQRTRELRTAIDSAVAKFSGAGPHPIRFGVVMTDQQNDEAIALYASQFKYPDGPELARLVTTPKKHSTRTRQRKTGNFTWYILAEATQEMACVVSVNVHNAGTYHFMEMPLCATKAGYKKFGLARLLNAALQEYCMESGIRFVLVSADPGAVPFWVNPTLGYSPISNGLKTRVEFHYSNECSKFTGSQLLTWEAPENPPQGGLGLVDNALSRMHGIVLNGPARLPVG